MLPEAQPLPGHQPLPTLTLAAAVLASSSAFFAASVASMFFTLYSIDSATSWMPDAQPPRSAAPSSALLATWRAIGTRPRQRGPPTPHRPPHTHQQRGGGGGMRRSGGWQAGLRVGGVKRARQTDGHRGHGGMK